MVHILLWHKKWGILVYLCFSLPMKLRVNIYKTKTSGLWAARGACLGAEGLL